MHSSTVLENRGPRSRCLQGHTESSGDCLQILVIFGNPCIAGFVAAQLQCLSLPSHGLLLSNLCTSLSPHQLPVKVTMSLKYLSNYFLQMTFSPYPYGFSVKMEALALLKLESLYRSSPIHFLFLFDPYLIST